MFALLGAAGCGGDDATDSGPSGGDPENSALLNGITKAHNNIRAGVKPAPATPLPALEWSGTVAAAAQSWANNCMYAHGGTGNYGQNIFASTNGSSPISVVADWASEGASYDYATNSCSGFTCGHYTQVVWAESTKLGCGAQTCTKNSPFSGSVSWQLWVCDYDPPGNFNGEKPY